MNAVEALDDYLLGLLAEAAPAPVTAAPDAPAGVASAATEQPAHVAAEAAADDNVAALPAEMDSDPAFAPSKPAPAAAPTLDIDANTAAMLAEMDADPAFAPPKPAPAPGPTLDIDANTAAMLAEMDADPAFAPPKPAPAPGPTLDIDANTAAMLAEMDADPAFAPPKPAPAPPALPAMTRPRPSAPIAPIARRAAAPRPSRLPPNIAAMFQPPPSDPSPHRRAAERSTRWLRLRCGEQTYALELLKVQEVVLPVPLLPLRGAARSMLGIMNLRGQVVPVLDLGLHLGAAPVVQDTQTRVVVLEENGETMGLRVSAVEDVASLTEQQIEPPDTTRLCRISNHLFRGVARISAHPVILLDATQLLH
ncbi:chemotaxis protein CheW [Stenotrophomonas sp. HITSZ_GD]|uniref:chemotaxis protein CheW n=1 Tax=Stenotrophomonas sp. HITSZ_GD TaxID=3037248 RepID=UPI00240E460E|nr:chemotaxis protein CheW [Stenotrophomonas sp. HITSZ_GD]MDG2526495.1 chemotaxis protein CheW [Stenotrophomonas sp. HITSZ_GD]